MSDVHVDCANCGITFCLTQGLYDRRLKDGKGFYCPNGHSNVYRPTEDQQRIKALERELAGWKDDMGHLQEHFTELYAQREELLGVLKECPYRCGWRSRRQVPRDPVSMGRGIERVQTDLREHLANDHRARVEVVRLLPERTAPVGR